MHLICPNPALFTQTTTSFPLAAKPQTAAFISLKHTVSLMCCTASERCQSFSSVHTIRLNTQIMLMWERGVLKVLKTSEQKLVQDLGFHYHLRNSKVFLCLVRAWSSKQMKTVTDPSLAGQTFRFTKLNAARHRTRAVCLQGQHPYLRTRASSVTSQSRLSTVSHINRGSASVHCTLPQSTALTLRILNQ